MTQPAHLPPFPKQDWPLPYHPIEESCRPFGRKVPSTRSWGSYSILPAQLGSCERNLRRILVSNRMEEAFAQTYGNSGRRLRSAVGIGPRVGVGLRLSASRQSLVTVCYAGGSPERFPHSLNQRLLRRRTGGSDLPESAIEVDGQTLRFNLLNVDSFQYFVAVPSSEGGYTFSGVIKNVDREEQAIAGHTHLRVGPPPTPVPTSTPTPSPTPTPTPEPTSTPIPTATSMPVSTATSTPVPTATPTATPVPVIAPLEDDAGGLGWWVWLLLLLTAVVLVAGGFWYAHRGRRR